MWLHIQTMIAVEELYTCNHTKEKEPDVKLSKNDHHKKPVAGPVILQVRAKKEFKKHALVLVPTGGRFELGFEPKVSGENIIDEAMLTHVQAKVTRFNTDRKVVDPKTNKRLQKIVELTIVSPLLASGKKQQDLVKNVPPFWGVLKTSTDMVVSNMELKYVPFSNMGFASIDKNIKLPKMQKGTAWTILVPILRNTLEIQQHEVLTLPFDQECTILANE